MLLPLALAAAMSATAASPKVAAIDFRTVKLKKQLGAQYAEHFAKRLADRGVDVIAPRQVASALPVKHRRLLDCAAKRPKCAADLAAALGVEDLITGVVSKSGKAFQVNVKVLSAATARPEFVYSKLVRKQTDIEEALDTAAQRLAQKLGVAAEPPELAELPDTPAETPPVTPPEPEKVAPTPTPTPEPTKVAAAPPKPEEPEVEDVLAPVPTLKRRHRSRGVKWQPWAVAGVGAVAMGVGAYFLVSANGSWSNLTGTPTLGYTPAMADAEAVAGANNRMLGSIIGGAGLAVAAVGVAWIFLEPSLRLLSVAPTQDGFMVSLAGRW